MSSAIPAPNRLPRGQLSRMLLLFILPLSLIQLALIGTLAYLYGRNLLELHYGLIFLAIALLIPWVLAGIFFRSLVKSLGTLTKTTRLFADGNWEQRMSFEKQAGLGLNEIGTLAQSFDLIADEVIELNRRLETRANESRNKLQSLAQLSWITATSPNLHEVLRHTLNQVIKSSTYYYLAVYVVETAGSESSPEWAKNLPGAQQPTTGTMTLRYKVGSSEFEKRLPESIDLASGENSDLPQQQSAGSISPLPLALQAIRTNHTQVEILPDPPTDLVEIWQAVVPIALRDQVLGVIVIYMPTTRSGSRLSTAQNATPDAGSRLQLPPPVQAEMQILATNLAFAIDTFSIGRKEAGGAAFDFPERPADTAVAEALPETPPVIPDLPWQITPPTGDSLRIPTEDLESLHLTRRRLTELETLWNISQKISLELQSAESDLTNLYQTIHQQILMAMGEISSFVIALYEPPEQGIGKTSKTPGELGAGTIRVPYMVENGEFLQIPPFPYGEGITSVIIRSGKPLRVVEDTHDTLQALGAKIVGEPAKSLLGVPLILAGETLGVILIEDTQREHRFDEEDERLLSTVASQVAIVLRNARLLENSRRQAELERRVNLITARIRQSADIESILRATTQELGAALKVRRAHIEINPLGQPAEDGFTDLPLADSQGYHHTDQEQGQETPLGG
ncbi:MAG: GAF domain-containing protein [Anaerolineales bacterium]|nr:GAF domain-containing protein [Anaerolineales bacterium]